LAHYNLIIPLT